MPYRFRKIVERPAFGAAALEILYDCDPVELDYMDGDDSTSGGVTELSWSVVQLYTPAGRNDNPIAIAEAQAALELEEGFEDWVEGQCLEDFAQRFPD